MFTLVQPASEVRGDDTIAGMIRRPSFGDLLRAVRVLASVVQRIVLKERNFSWAKSEGSPVRSG